jgi:hypothetical protein
MVAKMIRRHEELADQVWQLWAESYITDDLSMFAWFLIREYAGDALDSV